MAWHVVEKIADGRRYLGTYVTEEEAQTHFARLVDVDPLYEDALFVLENGDGGEEPSGEGPAVPPPLGHGGIDAASKIARDAVQNTRHPS
jgi:hypothetical protein